MEYLNYRNYTIFVTQNHQTSPADIPRLLCPERNLHRAINNALLPIWSFCNCNIIPLIPSQSLKREATKRAEKALDSELFNFSDMHWREKSLTKNWAKWLMFWLKVWNIASIWLKKSFQKSFKAYKFFYWGWWRLQKGCHGVAKAFSSFFHLPEFPCLKNFGYKVFKTAGHCLISLVLSKHCYHIRMARIQTFFARNPSNIRKHDISITEYNILQ